MVDGKKGLECSAMVLPYYSLTCEHCQRQTPVPTPNPQESERRLRGLPTDTWQIFFECTNCGRVSRCTVDSFHLERALKRDPTLVLLDIPGPKGLYWRIEHRCGYNNCGLLHVLFLRTWQYRSERDLARIAAKITKRGPTTRCRNGHEFEPTFEFVRAIEVFSIP